MDRPVTLLAYKIIPRWEVTGRLDHVRNAKNGGGVLGYTVADDRNGWGPDMAGDPEKGTNRSALAMGLSWQYNLNTTFKAEARFDRANLPVFFDIKTGEYRKSNSLFGTSVVVAF